MRRGKWYAVGAVVVVAALALGLAFGLAGGQEQSAPLAQGGLPPAGGINEGIQVHGHWTLEVREPDGSLVSHQEFENAILVGGTYLLTQLLNGNKTVGTMGIDLNCAPMSGSPFRDDVGQPASGYIFEPCPGDQGPNFFYDLNESVIEAPSPYYGLMLTGSAQAQAAGNITEVGTEFGFCNNPAPLGGCNCSNYVSYAYFTAATLPQPVQLAANQWVTATVNISFQ